MNRHIARAFVVCLLLTAAVLPAPAADPGNQGAEATRPAVEPETPPQADTVETGTPADERDAAAANAAAGEPMKTFVPTEKIEADSAVSFPIDI